MHNLTASSPIQEQLTFPDAPPPSDPPELQPRPARRMPTLRAIAEHWAGRDEFRVDLDVPHCFRCGRRFPHEHDIPGQHWNAASNCLERAHLVDRTLDGLDGVQNVIPLCYPCHLRMPSFADGREAIAWTAKGAPGRSGRSVAVSRGLKANAARGRSHATCPLGYKRVYDSSTGELLEQIADPATAWIPREIITRIAAGVPISDIARDLDQRGVPTPKGGRWFDARVRQVAINPIYIGKLKFEGELIEATWPAIVDAETFAAAQRVFNDPARKGTLPGRSKHLLSYLATCGKCGEPICSGARGGSPMYVCHINGCTAARQDWVDRYITALVVERLADLDPREDIRAQFEAAPLAARKGIVRLLFTSIRVEPAIRRGRVTRFDPDRVQFEWRRPG